MSTAANLHRRMFDAINHRDFDTLRTLFGRDSIHVSGDGVARKGAAPVVEEVESFSSAFPDLTITVQNHLVPSDKVSVIEYTFSGTHERPFAGLPPTGRKISVVGCSILEAEGEQVRREADYYDVATIMGQLGQ